MQIVNTATEDLGRFDAHTTELIYCGLDSMLTQEIYAVLDTKLIEPYRSTYEVERSHLDMVLCMMNRGIQIDPAMREMVISGLNARIAVVEANFKELCSYVGLDDINPRSYIQIGKLFWDCLSIPRHASVKKGEVKYTLDRDALEKLAKNYTRSIPFANCLMRLRDLSKTRDALSTKLSPSLRWHASFNIGGTDTGRWSSSPHPFDMGGNLQNIDDELRRAFIPDAGQIMFSCDQQGAEARLVAYLSGDENYIKALESGDVHTMVAGMVFGFEPTLENSSRKYYRDMTYRDIAKRAAHGSNYFGQPPTIAKVLHVETSVIEEFQKKYFKTFPGIREWQTWIAQQIQTVGYLDTPFGRRRHFWGRVWEDTALRAAIAYVPQSTVGELTNRGLYDIWKKHDPIIQVLNNGHDAAIGQLPENDVDLLMPKVLQCLTRPIDVTDIKGVTRNITIPWVPSTGKNWGKFKKDNPNGLKEEPLRWKIAT